MRRCWRRRRTGSPIELLVESADYYRLVSVPYFDGPRWPHLTRIEGTPDLLDADLDAAQQLRRGLGCWYGAGARAYTARPARSAGRARDSNNNSGERP